MRAAIVASVFALGLGAASAQEADAPACTLLPGEVSASLDCPGIANPYVPAPTPERSDPDIVATPFAPEPPEVESVAPGGELFTQDNLNRSAGLISNPRVRSPSLR